VVAACLEDRSGLLTLIRVLLQNRWQIATKTKASRPLALSLSPVSPVVIWRIVLEWQITTILTEAISGIAQSVARVPDFPTFSVASNMSVHATTRAFSVSLEPLVLGAVRLAHETNNAFASIRAVATSLVKLTIMTS
jgi:hypothetical protein